MNIISEIENQEIINANSQTPSSKIKWQFDRKILFAIIVFILTIFSWIGTIDRVSETFIDTSLKQAAIVYGTARAINATVSVLQTFSIPGIGLGVGQALDPLNSIVERFSTIMEISIGSLVIQKILIEITTNSFFNILLTISAIIIFVSVFIRNIFDFQLLAKIFLSLAFLRYAIVISLAMNGVISDAFIKDKIDTEADIIIKASTEASNDIEKHNETKKELEEIKNHSGKVDQSPPESPSQEATSPPPVENKGWLDKMKEKVFGQPSTDSTQPPVSDTAQKTKFEQVKEWLIKQKDKLKSTLDNFNPMNVAKKIQQVVQNMINLMAIILLQTLLLPIFFMYLMKWAVFTIWNVRIERFYTNLRSSKPNQLT